MNAILNKVGPKKTKTICGEVLQNGFNQITLVVGKPDGTRTIKRFAKHKYNITYY